MDGLELAEELCAGAAYAGEVPYLVGMTADLHHYNREQCLAAGMNEFLSKPITQDKLRPVLDSDDSES